MKILTFVPKDNAVTTYRQLRPLKDKAIVRRSLLRKNEKIQVKKLAERLYGLSKIWNIKYLHDRHTADLLVTIRNHTGAKLVMDIDDNIWQIPLGNVARGTNKEFAWNVYINTELVKSADWVTVSTKPLKDLLSKVNSNITVLPNYIDPQEWKFKRKRHDKVRIGWVWSKTHIPDTQTVKKALKEIYNKHKDKIEVVVFGTEEDIFDFPTTNIKGVPYKEYPKMLTEAGIDISICPLLDNDFNRSKSNIKWLESTMAGAAVVASKVYPYAQSIKHGKTGYLAQNHRQWMKYLEELILDEEKRKEMASEARKEVLRDYASDKEWNDFYEYLTEEAKKQ